MNDITVVYLKVDKVTPEVCVIHDSYKDLQSLVGGYFEVVEPKLCNDKSILSKYIIWVDEEGLLKKMPVNIVVNPDQFPDNIRAAMPLVGNLVVTGCNEEGATTSVEEADIPKVIAALKEKMAMNVFREMPR